jgi:glycine oxidase
VVQVIDDRPIAMGATQASAGVLAPYIEAREDMPLLPLAVRSLDLYDEFIERIRRDSGGTVLYRRTGTLNVALQDEGMKTLRSAAAVLARLGVAGELLDAAAARREEPYLPDDVIGALLVPTHGFVAAQALTQALAAAARRLGAQLVEGGRVRRIVRAGSTLRVETDRGAQTGDTVVVAAGSWSAQIEIDGVRDRLPVRPVRGQLLHVAWKGAPLHRVTWGDRCYLVPWDDGTLLVGGTVEEAGFDEQATVAGVRDLLDAACELVPHAWTARFTAARVGLRPGTSDDLPIIGRSSVLPNLVYATGHYRNGILLAPLTAEVVAAMILDGKTDAILAAVSPQRFGAL